MSTEKPRITITLTPEDYEVISRLSKLQRSPMSRVVSELVQEVAPVLSKVADSLELALRANQGVRANLRRAAEEAEAELRPIVESVKNQFDLFNVQVASLLEQAEPDGMEPGEAGRGASGTDATRRASPGSAFSAQTGVEGAGPQPVITGATESQRVPEKSPSRSNRKLKSASLGAK